MNDKIRVLLVEDEQTLADIVADTLNERDFAVTVAYDGIEGMRRFEACRPDVVVTDIMMPGMDGFTFVERLRDCGADVPVLFLSARSAAADVVRGFETGGNDYLRKPFAMSELAVRLRALAGRSRRTSQGAGVFPLGVLSFDAERRTLSGCGTVRELSARESELLLLLCRHRGEIVPTRAILQTIWGDDTFFNARSLHVYITRLRRCLAADPSLQLVNVRGVGYRLLR